MAGDRVQTIALAWLVLGLGVSPLVLGSVLLAKALTQALMLPFAGVLTDRVPPRLVVLAADGTRALLMAALLLVATSGARQLWPLYAIEILVGAADAFFVPAMAAVLPSVAQDEALAVANALLVTSEQVTMTAGPAAGGVLVAALGAAGAFGANACSFVFGAIGALALPRTVFAASPSSAEERSFTRQIAAGLAEARGMPALGGVLVLLVSSSLAFNGGFGLGLPALAHAGLGHSALTLGLLLAANGAGQLVGTLGAGMLGLPKRLGWLMIWHAVAAGAMFAVLALSGNVAVDCTVLFAGGVVGAYADDVAIPTWLQRNAKPGALGRLGSLVEIARVYPEPIALAAFGALANWSLPAAFLASAAVMGITAVVLGTSAAMRRLSP
jgi:MFS family permease